MRALRRVFCVIRAVVFGPDLPILPLDGSRSLRFLRVDFLEGQLLLLLVGAKRDLLDQLDLAALLRLVSTCGGAVGLRVHPPLRIYYVHPEAILTLSDGCLLPLADPASAVIWWNVGGRVQFAGCRIANQIIGWRTGLFCLAGIRRSSGHFELWADLLVGGNVEVYVDLDLLLVLGQAIIHRIAGPAAGVSVWRAGIIRRAEFLWVAAAQVQIARSGVIISVQILNIDEFIVRALCLRDGPFRVGKHFFRFLDLTLDGHLPHLLDGRGRPRLIYFLWVKHWLLRQEV